MEGAFKREKDRGAYNAKKKKKKKINKIKVCKKP